MFLVIAGFFLFVLLFWAGGYSGWNDTFILCTFCTVVGIWLRLREHVILCVPFLLVGALGVVAFFLGWV